MKGFVFSNEKIPEEIDEEQVNHLLAGIRNGDIDAINEAILGRMVFALRYASRACRILGNTRHVNDLISEGILGAVEAVHNVAAGKMFNHDNLSAYIVLTIKGRVVSYLRDLPLVKNATTSQLEADLEDRRFDKLEMQDTLARIIGDDKRAAKIVSLRAQGFTDQEIADELLISRSIVHRTRKKLYDLFCKR